MNRNSFFSVNISNHRLLLLLHHALCTIEHERVKQNTLIDTPSRRFVRQSSAAEEKRHEERISLSLSLSFLIDQPPRASLRVASCSTSVSTPSAGSCTYRTTEPRMKQFFTASCTPQRRHTYRHTRNERQDEPVSAYFASQCAPSSSESCALSVCHHHEQRLARTMCGNFSSSTTLVFRSLILRYWSTACSVPRIARSFFSSTMTSFPTSVLK